jgi:hypothetical protein
MKQLSGDIKQYEHKSWLWVGQLSCIAIGQYAHVLKIEGNIDRTSSLPWKQLRLSAHFINNKSQNTLNTQVWSSWLLASLSKGSGQYAIIAGLYSLTDVQQLNDILTAMVTLDSQNPPPMSSLPFLSQNPDCQAQWLSNK